MNDGIKLPRLRSLEDFLLGSARFQLPNFRDLEKWGNRVAHNLLYYQTNYLLMSIILILAITMLHPIKMLTGGLSVALMLGLFYFVNGASFRNFHPFFGVVLVLGGACIMVYLLLGSMLVFLVGILLPISSVFIHASLRLRNMKSKLSAIERALLNKTPMCVLLEKLGMEPDFLS